MRVPLYDHHLYVELRGCARGIALRFPYRRSVTDVFTRSRRIRGLSHWTLRSWARGLPAWRRRAYPLSFGTRFGKLMAKPPKLVDERELLVDDGKCDGEAQSSGVRRVALDLVQSVVCKE